MNERVAWFCDRAGTPCHLSTWADADEAGEHLYQVYSRSALDDAWPDADGSADRVAALRRQVAAAGGGLIAQTSQTGRVTTLHVVSVPGDGYDPATDLLLLSPGSEPEQRPLADCDITLEPGAFVLLPATRANQANLLALLDHLHRLPGDYRSLLLNVLRRPGLEAAMGRLERQLDQLDRQLTPAPTRAGQTPAAGRWPWLLAALLVLNLLGVAAAAFWVKASLGRAVSPSTGGQGASTAAPPWPILIEPQASAEPQAPYRPAAPWWLEPPCQPTGHGPGSGVPTPARPPQPVPPAEGKAGRGL